MRTQVISILNRKLELVGVDLTIILKGRYKKCLYIKMMIYSFLKEFNKWQLKYDNNFKTIKSKQSSLRQRNLYFFFEFMVSKKWCDNTARYYG